MILNFLNTKNNENGHDFKVTFNSTEMVSEIKNSKFAEVKQDVKLFITDEQNKGLNCIISHFKLEVGKL